MRPMHYVSTRGQSPHLSFVDMLLAGLAPDGGLYLPQLWPRISPEDIAAFRGMPYAQVSRNILARLTSDSFADWELAADVEAAYAGFDDDRIAPMTEVGEGLYQLELFHGPTFAFKDIALQILGKMFARALKKRGGKACVLVATSGDTGSAAIAALGGLENIEVFVLHPKGRVSEVQRRQMTTTTFDNVHNIALEGTFDDAQSIVKKLFGRKDFAASVHLTAVNSINFARLAAQTVYYFTAAAQFDVPPVFVVPTGNFGDVFAGEAAMRMGLPVEKLIVATNANDIMSRALNNGDYTVGVAQKTLSPSMDIQVASNFERAVFEASGRDAAWIADVFGNFSGTRALQLPDTVRAALAERYLAGRADDTATLTEISEMYQKTGRLIDPHTAVAFSVAKAFRDQTDGPMVVLSTAHPAKFAPAVEKATGVAPQLPPALAKIMTAAEKYDTLPADADSVQRYLESVVS